MKKVILAVFVLLLAFQSNVLAQDVTITPEEVTLESIIERLNQLESKLDELISLLIPVDDEIHDNAHVDILDDNETIEYTSGIYLVPNDMKYGIWKYQSDSPANNCEVNTYPTVSTNFSDTIDYQYSPTGYITVNEAVKLVELSSSWGSECTIKWVGDL